MIAITSSLISCSDLFEQFIAILVNVFPGTLLFALVSPFGTRGNWIMGSGTMVTWKPYITLWDGLVLINRGSQQWISARFVAREWLLQNQVPQFCYFPVFQNYLNWLTI